MFVGSSRFGTLFPMNNYSERPAPITIEFEPDFVNRLNQLLPANILCWINRRMMEPDTTSRCVDLHRFDKFRQRFRNAISNLGENCFFVFGLGEMSDQGGMAAFAPSVFRAGDDHDTFSPSRHRKTIRCSLRNWSTTFSASSRAMTRFRVTKPIF